MRHLWIVVVSLLVSAVHPCRAQETERPMVVKECVLIALQQAFDLKISALDRSVADSRARAATGAYDPLLTASVNFSDTTAPGGFDTRTGTFVDSQTDTTRASMGITGLLPTGGRFTVGASVTDTEGTSGPFPFSNASASGPYVELRQPLLENLLIDDVRLNIQLSRRDVTLAAHGFRQAMMVTVNRVEEAYYDLVAARENVRVQAAALQLAEELWEDNRKRVALGASAPLEEAESRSQAATSKAALLSAQRVVRSAENALKGVMVEDYQRWRQVSIQPRSQLSQQAPSFDFNASWTLAQTQRPELGRLQVQMEQQHWLVKRRRNERLPELDLTAAAGLTGSANELNRVIDQVMDRDAPFYSVGLNLALPLTHRREKENLRAAEAQAEQVRLRFLQLRQSVMIEVDEAISQVDTDFERLNATREAREFAEQALKNERAKLERGASTDFVVLQLQRNLTAARSEEIRSLTDFNKALAHLRWVEGSNLEAYQVRLVSEDETTLETDATP